MSLIPWFETKLWFTPSQNISFRTKVQGEHSFRRKKIKSVIQNNGQTFFFLTNKNRIY